MHRNLPQKYNSYKSAAEPVAAVAADSVVVPETAADSVVVAETVVVVAGAECYKHTSVVNSP